MGEGWSKLGRGRDTLGRKPSSRAGRRWRMRRKAMDHSTPWLHVEAFGAIVVATHDGLLVGIAIAVPGSPPIMSTRKLDRREHMRFRRIRTLQDRQRRERAGT